MDHNNRFRPKAVSASPASNITRRLLESQGENDDEADQDNAMAFGEDGLPQNMPRPVRLTAIERTAPPPVEANPTPELSSQNVESKAKDGANNNEGRSTNTSTGLTEKTDMILKKWLGIRTTPPDPSDQNADSNTNGSPKPEKVNKTIRKWQKRAMYGKAERASSLNIDEEYKSWYIDQRDRFRVQLPEAIQASLAEEVLQTLKPLQLRYEKLLGPDDELVSQAEARIREIEQQLSGMGKQHHIHRGVSRGVSLRSLASLTKLNIPPPESETAAKNEEGSKN